MKFITARKANDLASAIVSKDSEVGFDVGVEIFDGLSRIFDQVEDRSKNGYSKTFWGVYIRGDQETLNNYNSVNYVISILESLGYNLDIKITKWFDHLPPYPSEELINSQTVPENGRDYEIWVSW